MTCDLNGQHIDIETADGAILSALLLRPRTSTPSAPPPHADTHKASSSTPVKNGMSVTASGPNPSAGIRALGPEGWRSSHSWRDSDKRRSVATVVRFYGNSEAWEMTDKALVQAYLEAHTTIISLYYIVALQPRPTWRHTRQQVYTICFYFSSLCSFM